MKLILKNVNASEKMGFGRASSRYKSQKPEIEICKSIYLGE